MTSPPASSPPDLERMFLSALPVIERIIAIQVRRHALGAGDAEDYASWARARLIIDEYVVFKKFGGRSSLQTYLTAVFINLFRDYRNIVWGRWRPSAAAKRLGATAVRLEDLIGRQALSIREAAQVLRAAGTSLSDADINRLAAKLPSRPVSREVALDDEEGVGADAVPDAAGPPTGRDELTERVEVAIRTLVAALPEEDAVILRMRFWDGVSVADIARALRLEQKALYRRIDNIGARLRAALEAAGIDHSLAHEILSGEESW